jgi:site-specific DNA-methyltransferase (cytosine-N4-specific)
MTNKIAFKTSGGESFHGDSLKLIKSKRFKKKYEGKIDLIFTSPPFNLVKKKAYGNETGEEYINWLSEFAEPLADLLSETGSIVIELGNAWEKGSPVFSTIPMEALLNFKRKANLHLCQEFICHNPSRIPSPAEWTTIRRIRVKDSYTRLWWLSKTEFPKADNKKVLHEYGQSMKNLIKSKKLKTGKRPSGHTITDNFLKDNGGSISSNFLDPEFDPYLFHTDNALSIPNANTERVYNSFCEFNNLEKHPARMQLPLIEYFIRFLTDENDIVFDPFGGSNATGFIAEKNRRRWVSSELNIDYIKGSFVRFFDEHTSRNKIKRMAE